MLRLLRNLRRNLFSTSGTQKYLLYAGGEILLIVIGVLLALQLSNWNNIRVMRIEEKQVLVRLNEELESSLSRISLFERAVKRKEQALVDVEPYLNGKPIEDHEAFIKLVVVASAFGWEQPVMEQTTFEEIKSSGRLSLIRDLNLRLSITRFFHTTKQREHRSEVRMTEFPKVTYRYVPLTQQNMLEEGLSEESLALIVENILQSNLREFVLPELNRARFILSIWEQIKEEGNAVLERIMDVRGMQGAMTEMEERLERIESNRALRNLGVVDESSSERP